MIEPNEPVTLSACLKNWSWGFSAWEFYLSNHGSRELIPKRKVGKFEKPIVALYRRDIQHAHKDATLRIVRFFM